MKKRNLLSVLLTLTVACMYLCCTCFATNMVSESSFDAKENVEIHFYVNENNEAIIYDPEIVPYDTFYGNSGIITLTWIGNRSVYWGVTAKSEGLMYLNGSVGIGVYKTGLYNYHHISGLSFEGSTDGVINEITFKDQTYEAKFSAVMINADGISISLPEAKVYRYIS